MITNEKAALYATPIAQKALKRRSSPLRSRRLDLTYVIFFVSHIPPTLLLDVVSLYPYWIFPEDSILRSMGAYYVKMTNDPVVGGVNGFFGEAIRQHMMWLSSFLHIEVFFQLPVFFYGAYNLYHNRNLHILYPLLTIYGASTAVTTLPCLLMMVNAPAPGTAGLNIYGTTLSDGQRWTLLASYIPFFVIPLLIAVDMACRTSKLISKGLKEAKQEGKWD